MKLADLKKYRNVIIGLIVVILILLIILAAFTTRKTTEEQEEETTYQEQDPTKIEDIKAALPYVESEYRLSYSYDSEMFIVTYPGYKTVDEMEVKTIAWLKQYTDYTDVKIKYGEVGGEIREYDLTKDTKELLKDNTYIEYDESGQYGTS